MITLKLSQDKMAVIDNEDGDLTTFKWSLITTKSGNTYAMRHFGKKVVYLHRLILCRIVGHPLERHEEVSFIDSNGLNCQRENLRLATRQDNARHRRGYAASGFKGVYPMNGSAGYQAKVVADSEVHYLGLFDTPEDAHEAYCAKAKELHGGFWNPG